jgi:hypothetical protein
MVIRLTSVLLIRVGGWFDHCTTATTECDACAEGVLIPGHGDDVYDTEPTRLAFTVLLSRAYQHPNVIGSVIKM